MTGGPGLGDVLGHWEPAPGVLLALALTGAAYALGVRRAGRWSPWRSAAFAAGLVLVAVALCSGLDPWSERLLSVHMVQHLLLGTLAPLALVTGAPVRLALRAARRPARRRIARALHTPLAAVLGHPATGWAALTAVLLGTHLTGLYELALRDPLVHELEHLAYLGAGLLFWAPLVAADPLPRRAGIVGRMAWLLASMIPMGVVGARLLSGALAYPAYVAPARALGIAPLENQRDAASLMWVGGTLVVALALVALVYGALRREEARQRRREAALGLPPLSTGTAR
jgi:putative membrane protein